jgi:hypothetical protein
MSADSIAISVPPPNPDIGLRERRSIVDTVDGAAYAGGCELALASAFICASEHARDRHQQTFKFLQIAKLDPNAPGSAAKPTHLPR